MLRVFITLLFLVPPSISMSGDIMPVYSPPFFHVDLVTSETASILGDVDTTTFKIKVTNMTSAPIFAVTVCFASDRHDVYMPDASIYLPALASGETVLIADSFVRTTNTSQTSALPEIRMHGIMEYVNSHGELREDEVLLIERF